MSPKRKQARTLLPIIDFTKQVYRVLALDLRGPSIRVAWPPNRPSARVRRSDYGCSCILTPRL